MAHLMEPPPDARERMPSLSERVALALQRAMAKQLDERFDSAGEFVAALLK